jgi:4-aminobutyrate aminotransferase-like enzyme
MNDLKAKGLNFDNIAGFIIESYLGWGAIFYPVEYIKALSDFAKEHNCIVTFDEIQGGFGRTGKLFVYQHYNVEPDLLCLGKALSGSLPLSAVVGSQKIMDLPEFGSMSSTHSANPLCCAAGLANLEAIESGNLIEESARKGEILHRKLNILKEKYHDRIAYVFGKGLLAGIIFKHPKTGEPDELFPSRVCEKAMQKGLLLVHTGRESIKIGPPLTIPDDALMEGLDVLDEAITETIRQIR